MKYRLYVDKRAWVTDTYEMDIPDSILAEMMDEEGEIDLNALFEYMYYDSDPIESEITDEEMRDWTIEKMEEESDE